MESGHRLLEHTADMGIEGHAESCERVLEEMARGLTSMLFGNSPSSPSVVKTFFLQAEDPVELMVTWLNEIVYWCEQGDLIPASIHIESVTENRLRGTLSGEPFNPQRHRVEHQVKSVTYHQACLEETPAGWHARVYVDL